MPKKTVAAMAALLALVAVLMAGATNQRAKGPSGDATGLSGLLGGLSFPSNASLPSLSDTFTVTAAWGVFQDYLKAAHAHDLAKVKSLSYQVSEACANPAKKAECETLMDSVYTIASGFKAEDFKNVAYDDKQIIMSTDYMDMGEGADKTKVALYFVKAESGAPLLLGIRFCYGEESGSQCVTTDPNRRDSDKDGWWDGIEALFYEK